jgi:hypothetical protein
MDCSTGLYHPSLLVGEHAVDFNQIPVAQRQLIPR